MNGEMLGNFPYTYDKNNQTSDIPMSQRQAAGLLAGISIALIGAETALAVLHGFDPGVILFCLAIAVGAAGLVFAVSLLAGDGQRRVESVSERRARARAGDAGSRFEAYGIDDEFLGNGRPGRGAAAPAGEPFADDAALKAAVAAHAAAAGGLVALRETLAGLDDDAFRVMAGKFGFSGVSRIRAMGVVTELIAAEVAVGKASEVPPLSISIDQETFDDYIRRCMTDGGSEPPAAGAESGFSVGLDADGLSGLPGDPPATFSHDPQAVFSKIGRSGGGAGR